MAKHEFGIMNTPPKPHTRYDEYEPQKYNCIEVDDRYIEVIDGKLDADTYWHTLDVKGKGLAYCGITLIPPEAIDSLLALVDYQPLAELLKKAKNENKFVIHYGL
ncbi:MAG: hypothetical protein IKL05_06320 [Clostridia bacterium]|nr:hypothetical protein [Clostridia bacterium]